MNPFLLTILRGAKPQIIDWMRKRALRLPASEVTRLAKQYHQDAATVKAINDAMIEAAVAAIQKL